MSLSAACYWFQVCGLTEGPLFDAESVNVSTSLRKQPELPERGAILLQDNATPICHRDVQNLVQRWG
jgi:hypothetical protein